MRGLDERARGRRAIAVAVPRDADEARRDELAELDDLDRAVGRLQRQPRHERDADARADESLHGAVVVAAKDDARLAAGTPDRGLDAFHAAALPVADQRLLRDLAQRRWLCAAGER